MTAMSLHCTLCCVQHTHLHKRHDALAAAGLQATAYGGRGLCERGAGPHVHVVVHKH